MIKKIYSFQINKEKRKEKENCIDWTRSKKGT